MEAAADHIQWVEKYRPHRLADLVLPERIAAELLGMARTKTLPNLLFCGPPGTGKTSAARALAADLGFDSLELNASDDKTAGLVNSARGFAYSVSMSGTRKLVIVDEVEWLNPKTAQPGLRSLIEEAAGNCTFVLVCNVPDALMSPLQSRTSRIDFTVREEERHAVAQAFMNRATAILKTERIEHDPALLETAVNALFPDWRRLLNELQRSSIGGTLRPVLEPAQAETDIVSLLQYMRLKDITKIRDWASVRPGEASQTLRALYANAERIFIPAKLPGALVALAECASALNSPAQQEMLLVATLARLAAWESVDS